MRLALLRPVLPATQYQMRPVHQPWARRTFRYHFRPRRFESSRRRAMSIARRPALPSEPFFRAAYVQPLLALLRARRIDPGPLLAGAGCGEGDFDEPGTSVPFLRIVRLCGLIRRALPDPLLPLAWGARMSERAHGLPGLAMTTAPTVGEAIAVFAAVAALRSTTIRFDVQTGPEVCRLTAQPVVSLGPESEFILVPVAMMVSGLLKQVLGEAATQLTVDLPFAAPSWADAAAAHFACRLRFGQPQLAVQVPGTLLARRNPLADTESHAVAIAQCRLDQLRLDRSLRQRVTLHLAEHIELAPTAASTAAMLCISERTLRRELQAEGVGFRELHGAMRIEAACRHLADTPLTVEQIAWRLGYREASNFVRAFRRQLGVTPQQYRRARRLPSV